MSKSVRTRARFSRSLSASRFREYSRLLDGLAGAGYRTCTVEEWIDDPDRFRPPLVILRHDVDQHTRAVLPMLRAETQRGLRATWYFRWRTASEDAIGRVRAAGGEVGLHYETLSRLVMATSRDADAELVAQARDELRTEIQTFGDRFGPIRSVAAHGDTRVPGVNNVDLLRGEDLRDYGIEYDANLSLPLRRLGRWLTDRSAAEGRWKDGEDPSDLLARRISPILLLTHPNNWASGAALWSDRIRLRRSPRDSPS